MSSPSFQYYQVITYTVCDRDVYQQDIVVHRVAGVNYEEAVGGLNVWHVFIGDKCRADYGDIRFINSVGTELNYYLWSNFNEMCARFTVKLENANQSNLLQIHYGNPTAVDNSNGDATFHLFDHFDGFAINMDKWAIGSGTWDVIDGCLRSTGTGLGLWISTKTPIIPSIDDGWIFEFRAQHYTNTNDNDVFSIRFGEASGRYIYYHWKKSGNAGEIGYSKTPIPGTLNGQTWYRIIVALNGVKATGWVFRDNGTLVGTSQGSDAPNVVNQTVGFHAYGKDGCFDYISIRNYSENPPSIIKFSDEQMNSDTHTHTHRQSVSFGSDSLMVIQ